MAQVGEWRDEDQIALPPLWTPLDVGMVPSFSSEDAPNRLCLIRSLLVSTNLFLFSSSATSHFDGQYWRECITRKRLDGLVSTSIVWHTRYISWCVSCSHSIALLYATLFCSATVYGLEEIPRGGELSQCIEAPCSIPDKSLIYGLSLDSSELIEYGGSTIKTFKTGTNEKTPGPDPNNLLMLARIVTTSKKYDEKSIVQTRVELTNRAIGSYPPMKDYIYRLSYSQAGLPEKYDKYFFLSNLDSCFFVIDEFKSPHPPRIAAYALPEKVPSRKSPP